jgi:uncharacterized protein
VNGKTSGKCEKLKQYLKELKTVAVAFSGGMDSTFLLKVAHDVLGDNVLAITVASALFPKRELQQAKHFVQNHGIAHSIVHAEVLKNTEFSKNTHHRCYYCKKELCAILQRVASEKNIKHVLEGSNFDDLNDYRPGTKALKEFGFKSPLQEVKLTKSDIRALSQAMNLSTWDKPAFACLASRVPYGVQITKSRLNMVEQAEDFLQKVGVKQFRVRFHNELARIEVLPDDFQRILSHADEIVTEFTKIGFTYITLDIKGYRTGSLNEVIQQ